MPVSQTSESSPVVTNNVYDLHVIFLPSVNPHNHGSNMALLREELGIDIMTVDQKMQKEELCKVFGAFALFRKETLHSCWRKINSRTAATCLFFLQSYGKGTLKAFRKTAAITKGRSNFSVIIVYNNSIACIARYMMVASKADGCIRNDWKEARHICRLEIRIEQFWCTSDSSDR